MAIYGISDLHLSFSTNKSMEVFGKDWENYEEKIKENWQNIVKEEDTVIIAGDVSWATKIEEAYEDFKFINDLPGIKIMLKGNHDYYFSTKSKIDKYLKENNLDKINILHNNSYYMDGYLICGTRGWGNVDNLQDGADVDKIYSREALRLELSIKDGLEKYGEDKKIILATHFPPFYQEMQDVIQKYKENIKVCIYGHLHGFGHNQIKEGNIDGVEYKMVSIDYTGCNLIKLS